MQGKRIKKAWNKLLFCWNISGSISSFFALTLNTKKYKWSKSRPKSKVKMNDRPVKYALRFGNKKRIVFLRTYCGDLDIFYEIFFEKAYAYPFSNHPLFIMDIGANIGLASLYFLNRFPDCKIISLEPDPANVAVFKKNLSFEINEQKIFITEAALSNTDGYMFISKPFLKYNPKILEDQNSDEEKIEVKVISMNSFLEKCSVDRIDIVKMDIEGSELQLFSSDTAWLTMVREIIMEVHSLTAYEVCNKALDNNFKINGSFDTSFPQIIHWVGR
ncbi:MAG: FkbM family methyltransferase [Ginsengibacter sp.]